MRIVHISTSVHGGAGIAATRLHRALLSAGHDSFMIARDSDSCVPNLITQQLPLAKRPLSGLTTLACRLASDRDGSFFSPYSLQTLSSAPITALQPDVLVVHNWFNQFANPVTALQLSPAAPVIFVMHDQRLFTGACHHADECEGFISKCERCPQTYKILRARVSRNLTNSISLNRRLKVAAVAPSRWLLDKARESTVLRTMDLHHVPNTLDPSTFDPHRKVRARRKFGISDDALVMAWQPGKGDDLFPETMNVLADTSLRRKPTVLHTGSTRPDDTPFASIAAGHLSTEDDRADFWAAADVGCSLTARDNFPNIVLESLASGTPFVAPRIGGAYEAINETRGGIACDRTSTGMAQGIQTLLDNSRLRETLSKSAREGLLRSYAPQLVARQYLALFSSMI
mgnify:CR=1 FL=1